MVSQTILYFFTPKLWLKRTLWCLLTMQMYLDSILKILQRINVFAHSDAFFLQNCIYWILFRTLTIIFDVLEEIIGKNIESRYIGIYSIIDKVIDIGERLPQIIGDFRELSAKLFGQLPITLYRCIVQCVQSIVS